MEKVILYYRFAPIADPEAVRLWQKALCEKLGLKGRIIISTHGINGTLGGKIADLKSYARETKQFPSFKNTDFKWSDSDGNIFPKLSVKVRDEIVTFGAANEIKVDQNGIVGGGEHIKPGQLDELVERYGDDLVLFDGRNTYEAAVGRFKNAVIPDVRTTKDFKAELEKPKYDKLRDQPVVTYCTGGIRCEVLTVLMKNRGFREVYQMDGGIIKYGDRFGDDGYWQGSLYMFDGRMGLKFSDKAKDIAKCIACGIRTSTYKNCANNECNELIIMCDECAQPAVCSERCQQTLITSPAT